MSVILSNDDLRTYGMPRIKGPGEDEVFGKDLCFPGGAQITVPLWYANGLLALREDGSPKYRGWANRMRVQYGTDGKPLPIADNTMIAVKSPFSGQTAAFEATVRARRQAKAAAAAAKVAPEVKRVAKRIAKLERSTSRKQPAKAQKRG